MSLVKRDLGRLQRTSAKISDFQTTASPCPGASEFPKPPLPGRPRPDFPNIIFTQLEKSKNWVNRRIRRLTPVDILVKYKVLIVLLPV